jgi:hypothetical protein
MENNKSAIENILALAGLLALFAIVARAYKSVSSETETHVISEDGLKAIQDPETADKLREAVDQYHDTGDWKKTKLESIL